MDSAIAANVAAAEECRHLPAFERAACLRRIADGLEARRAAFAPRGARGGQAHHAGSDRDRSRDLRLRDGAEEATRIRGEVLPLDVMPAGRGRLGFTRRWPLSPVAAITRSTSRCCWRPTRSHRPSRAAPP